MASRLHQTGSGHSLHVNLKRMSANSSHLELFFRAWDTERARLNAFYGVPFPLAFVFPLLDQTPFNPRIFSDFCIVILLEPFKFDKH